MNLAAFSDLFEYFNILLQVVRKAVTAGYFANACRLEVRELFEHTVLSHFCIWNFLFLTEDEFLFPHGTLWWLETTRAVLTYGYHLLLSSLKGIN